MSDNRPAKFNTNQFYAINASKDILKASSHVEATKVSRDIKDTFALYNKTFFDGDIKNWDTQKQPRIFYKHLFRQYLYEITGNISEASRIETKLTGIKTHYNTISHSIDQDPDQFTLPKRRLKEARIILGRADVAEKVMDKLRQGYSHDDIARQSLVAKEAVMRILQGKVVSNHILAQIDESL